MRVAAVVFVAAMIDFEIKGTLAVDNVDCSETDTQPKASFDHNGELFDGESAFAENDTADVTFAIEADSSDGQPTSSRKFLMGHAMGEGLDL